MYSKNIWFLCYFEDKYKYTYQQKKKRGGNQIRFFTTDHQKIQVTKIYSKNNQLFLREKKNKKSGSMVPYYHISTKHIQNKGSLH